MALNSDPASPSRQSRDLLTRYSIPTLVIVGTLLLSLIVLLGTYLFGGFNGLSASGIGALIFGVIATFALGIGLMVAVFYSSRQYDDAAHYAAMDQFAKKTRPSNQPAEHPDQTSRP